MNVFFVYGTPYPTECYGGIKHWNCNNDAVWSMYSKDDPSHHISLLCDQCKKDREDFTAEGDSSE
jgi:hypothetical protein